MKLQEIEIIRRALDTEVSHKEYVKNVTKAKNILNKYETLQANTDQSKLLLADVMPSFEYFKECRKKLQLSMQEVMAKTGVSKATISRLEKGNEVFYSNVKTLYEFYRSNEV